MITNESKHVVPKDINEPQAKGKSIAITGKGGTGKTMLATLMIKILAETGHYSILAVDADSAMSLPYTLDMKIGRTVGDFRQEVIENPQVKRKLDNGHIRTAIADIVEHGNGFDLLVMGRPEAPGCYCTVNDLLRYGISTLSDGYDFTIIDGEAGPEQVNRRVMQHIDALFVVADSSLRSLQTAETIMHVAQHQGITASGIAGLIINRYKSETGAPHKCTSPSGFDILGYIPEDDNVRHYDSIGKSLLELPSNSPSLTSVGEILKRFA